MTDVIFVQDSTIPADFSGVSTEDLRRELAASIGVTARTLVRMATIWAELERRGEDLSALRSGLMAYMPAIADGSLDPEAVVRCAGQATVLKMLASLPLIEQRRVLERGVPLLELQAEGGDMRTVDVPIERLSVAQARRAFAVDHIRSATDQAQLLLPRAKAQTTSLTRGTHVTVRFTAAEYAIIRAKAAAVGKRVPTFLRDLALDDQQDVPR